MDYAGLTVSPCQNLRMLSSEVKRDRVLNDDELRRVLKAIQKMGTPWNECFLLLILTGARLNEVAEAVWTEITLNEEVNEWLLPSARSKNSRAHLLPLSPMAVQTLKRINPLHKCPYVFSVTGKTSIVGFSKAKKRLDQIIKEDSQDKVGLEPWRFHDLRRTVATGMARLGVHPHVVEAVLNHVSGAMAGVAGIYNRHGYYNEKKEALQIWAQHIDELSQSY
ncbi:tyrosine-type recombinase/integrase [Bartonella sp. B17]